MQIVPAVLRSTGQIDLVVGNPSRSQIAILRANNGSYDQNPQPETLTGVAPIGLVSGDFNHDGFIDIALADRNTHGTGIMLNNTSGNLNNPVFVNQDVPGQWGIAAADFDHDGTMDLVVTSWTSTGGSYISVLRNTSTHTSISFEREMLYRTGSTEIEGVTTGDLDGDGLADDFAVLDTGGKIWIYRNKRTAQTPDGAWLGFTGDNITFSAVSDAEIAAGYLTNPQNGAMDLVFANNTSGTNNLGVILNSTTPNGDCDANGVPDSCELANNDCDENGLIDSCVIESNSALDCNDNEVLDSCDITSGTSTDYDNNTVPDECEECYTPPQDTNGDAHVDATDFDVFSACYNGPTHYYPADHNCVCMDYNRDHFIDASDFDAFSECYNGPTNPPGCGGGSGMQMMSMMFAESGMESEGCEVAFDLQSGQAGQSLTAGTPVAWNVAAAVTGASNGLAGYSLSLGLLQGTANGPLARITLAMPTFSDSFHVGENGFTTLYNPLVAGGPLMVGMISNGRNTTAGEINGIGA